MYTEEDTDKATDNTIEKTGQHEKKDNRQKEAEEKKDARKDLRSKNKKKKIIRRGKGKNKRLSNFSLVYSNCRGLKGKKQSINHIVQELKPSIVCLVETHLEQKEDYKLEGYNVNPFNIGHDREGIVVAWKENISGLIQEVHRSNSVGQMMWLTLKSHGNVSVRLGVVYAPQESRTLKANLKEMYMEIKSQITLAKQQGQKVLIVGDFNCRIGKSIPGNTDSISKGGRLLKKLVKDENLVIGNATEVCKGLWTRVEKEKKSAIDFVLMSEDTSRSLKKMIIDEDKEFPVYRQEGEDNQVFSDHNTIVLDIDWLIHKSKEADRKIITSKGFAKYRDILIDKEVSKILCHSSLQESYNKWTEAIESSIKMVSQRKKVRRNRKLKKWIEHKRMIRKMKAYTQESKNIRKERLNLIRQRIHHEEKSKETKRINHIIQDLRQKDGVHGPTL